ncbi:MAG: hypothetical protein OER86_11660, partial [Phycisphaerae bacterium]|nr:hypothetical protein [Phycisphaerae bacterium]
MKRLLLLALGVGLIGCEPNESNQQQIQASADFAEAERQLRQAVTGTIDQPVKDDPKLRPIKHLVTIRPYGKSIAEFRNEKLAEPLVKLEKLARDPKGRPYQKVAASQAAAEIYRGRARFTGEAAASAWSNQLDRVAGLINDSSAVRFHQRVAAEQNKVDFSGLLAKLRAEEEQRSQGVAQLTTATSQFTSQAQKLKADMARFKGERDKQILEADKLSAKAFTAKGQERYDLQVLAAKAKRSADTFTRQADEAAAKLDPITTALATDQSKLAAARAQLEQVRDSITKLNERIQEKNQLAATADKAAREAAESFEKTFAAIAATQEKDVDAKFEAAEADATKASEILEHAVRSASSDSSGLTRLHVDLDLHGTWATLGFIQHQKAMVNFAYNRTLRRVATAVRDALPQQARMASEAAGDADMRSAHAVERARDNFGFALENMEKLAETAKTGNQAELEQVARAQAREVREALATIEKGPKPTPTAVAQARAALPKRGEVAPPVAVTPTTPTTPTTPPAAAGTPEAAVQAVFDGLAANKPQVLWDALPASYQKQA